MLFSSRTPVTMAYATDDKPRNPLYYQERPDSARERGRSSAHMTNGSTPLR